MTEQAEKTESTCCEFYFDKEKCEECGKPIIKEQTCDRCGSKTEVSLHYWAPEEFFDDFIFWPKSLLCEKCRELWLKNMPQVAEPRSEKIFNKADIAKSMQRFESYEILWFDIPDIIADSKDSLEGFLADCRDYFTVPGQAYRNEGWKVIGRHIIGDVERMFALRPCNEKKV
jgi:hypothetical protein